MLCVRAVPAPGYRDFGRAGDEGEIRNVGNNGMSWSSTVSGTNAFFLNFNTTNLNPSNANNRAHGFQVRCLQAFIGGPCPIYRKRSGVFCSGVPAPTERFRQSER